MILQNADGQLVTVLITSRNRPDELRSTLKTLRSQEYRPIELVVVDDHSNQPLEAIVSREWPGARVYRNADNLGLIASRSLGMRLASGADILSLDDDSCLIDPQCLSCAVARMGEAPDLGVLTFCVHPGLEFDANRRGAASES